MSEKRRTPAELEIAEMVSSPSQEEAALEALPGGLKPLPTIHDDLAQELLALADRQVAEIRKLLGSQSAKPKLKRIEQIFKAKAGSAPHVGEELERLMRIPTVAPKTAALDASFDRAMAMALNTYDKESVRAGSNIQSAFDDWAMAVRIYKSELRAAGSTLAAQIELATHQHDSEDYDYDEQPRGAPVVRHYATAAKIAQSMVSYEKTMQQAGADLATAYGKLMGQVYSTIDMLALAETVLISAVQTAYSAFWTGVQSAVSQARPDR